MNVERLSPMDVKLGLARERLSRGAQKHIRRLKQEGRLDEIEPFRIQQESAKRYRTSRQRLEDEKNKSLSRLVFSQDREIQAEEAFRLTMLLSQSGEILASEREDDLYKIHKTWPDQGDHLREIEVKTVVEVAKLVEEAGRG